MTYSWSISSLKYTIKYPQKNFLFIAVGAKYSMYNERDVVKKKLVRVYLAEDYFHCALRKEYFNESK